MSLRRAGRWLALAPLAVSLMALSCEEESPNVDGNPQGDELCAEAATRLRGCQLLSEGEVNCRLFQSQAYVECFRPCLDAASCDDIRAQTCDDVDNTFALCKDRCEYEAVVNFDCGDGTRIDTDQRCDEVRDCANGSDELGCADPVPMFDCGGEQVEQEERCDGTSDCANGRDEEGCPVRAMTLCPGGF